MRDIAEGEQLFIVYGIGPADLPELYGFSCACERCQPGEGRGTSSGRGGGGGIVACEAAASGTSGKHGGEKKIGSSTRRSSRR